MPRLPIRVPRSGRATISPNGVTRFWRGIEPPGQPFYGTMIAGGNPGSGTMTIAQRGQRTLTLDEFLALPEEKPALEYSSGVITRKMSPDRDHGGLEYIIC